jgi:ribonuclease J
MEKLKIIPLGGFEEVGKNCLAIEYGQDIIVIDMGFDFPGQDFPGIDYLLPDITYLEENKEKIRGVIITHGHLDHIGGLPYLLGKINNPPIFATTLTLGFIEDRLLDVGTKNKAKLNTIWQNKNFSLGVFKITPFYVVHNIPDSVGLAIETPFGTIIHTGDFKIDESPVDQKPLEKDKIKHLSKKGALLLLSDSTNATIPGHSVPEKEVGKVIDQIIKQAPSRLIFTTFATLISRIQQIIYACQKYNRKIALVGMAMQKSVAIAQNLGYLNVNKNIFIKPEEINNYPDNKLVVLAGGSQGVEGSSMARMSKNKHWFVKIKKGDTVVFSSSAIPGSEVAIQQMMDGLVNQGARIIYRSVIGAGVHSSGHAFQEELKQMIKLVRPKFFIPIEGQHYMQAEHIELAKGLNVRPENCFMFYNNQFLEIDKDQRAKIIKKKSLEKMVAVEGKRIKNLDKAIFATRKGLAESGVCFVNVCQRKIQIVFSGLFVEEDVTKEIKNKIERLISKYGRKNRTKIQMSLGDFILHKIGKKPMIFLIIN